MIGIKEAAVLLDLDVLAFADVQNLAAVAVFFPELARDRHRFVLKTYQVGYFQTGLVELGFVTNPSWDTVDLDLQIAGFLRVALLRVDDLPGETV